MATNPPLGWSELASDVLSLIYNRLSFADFARARTVCSSWYSIPRKNHVVPWLIFSEDEKWKLFDPEEGKFYTTQNNHCFGTWCRSLATCGNWVLITDNRACLYIFNSFTSEIINLPPIALYGKIKLHGNCPIHLDYGLGSRRRVHVETAVLWVDERSKDYLVVWKTYGKGRLCFCRKGYEEWIEILEQVWVPSHEKFKESVDPLVDIAYKDKKLYILTECYMIYILDFSQEFPRIAPNNPYVNLIFRLDSYIHPCIKRLKLTTSGDVVLMIKKEYPNITFEVYKVNSTSKEWERVYSLEEDEALVWDLSVTLATKGVSGVKKDSIYFCDYIRCYEPSSYLRASTYEIPTARIEDFEQCSHMVGHITDARWFIPCFGIGE